MGIYDWSTTASNNATVGSINWQEGQAPSTVNNSARQEMADVAAWRDLLSGGVASTGSANVYALTTGTSVPSLAHGRVVGFRANFSNTSTATLNVDSLGAKAIRYQDSSGDRAIYAGAIANGNFYHAVYSEDADSSSGGWIVLNPTDEIGSFTPTLQNATTTTYSAQEGAYTRSGSVVTIRVGLVITSIGNGSTFVIVGAPPAATSLSSLAASRSSGLVANVVGLFPTIDTSGNITVQSMTAAATGTSDNAIFGNGSAIYIGGSYRV